MTNEIATKQQQTSEIELDTEDVKQYIAPEATDKELFFFMNIAKSFGLNPFKREIHFVKYGSQPGQTIVGYETYLKRAEQTGLLDGWSVWMDKDGIGEKAVLKIFRKDRTYPFVWEAYRNEFDKQQSIWKNKPRFMLKKVCISQGFRLAFPEDIGGMPYTSEEVQDIMPQNGNSQQQEPKQSSNSTKSTENKNQTQNSGVQLITQKQMNLLKQQLQILTTDPDEMKNKCNAWLSNNGYEQINSTKELTKNTTTKLIDAIKQQVEEEAIKNHPNNQSSDNMDEDPFAEPTEQTK